MRRRAFTAGIVLLSLALVTAGCGRSYGTPVRVKGKVLLGGASPKDMNIIFQAKKGLPADKRIAQTAIKADGTYELSGVYPADYEVTLQSSAPVDLTMNEAVPAAVAALPMNQDGSAMAKPAKVSSGATEFNFEF